VSAGCAEYMARAGCSRGHCRSSHGGSVSSAKRQNALGFKKQKNYSARTREEAGS